MCAEAGADVVFVPPVSEMYPSWPEPPATTISVRGVSDAWEGASRPGHFDGVATVVAKLFSAAGPCRAYFGLKDFQQLAVVRAMTTDLGLPVEVVGCAIVREPDGLALSSRNVRLSDAERAAALALSRALAAGRAAIAGGERAGAAVGRAMSAAASAEPLVELDYAVAVDAATLEPVDAIDDPAAVRLLIAAVVGPVRLIDNSAALDDADNDPTDPTAHDSPRPTRPAPTANSKGSGEPDAPPHDEVQDPPRHRHRGQPQLRRVDLPRHRAHGARRHPPLRAGRRPRHRQRRALRDVRHRGRARPGLPQRRSRPPRRAGGQGDRHHLRRVRPRGARVVHAARRARRRAQPGRSTRRPRASTPSWRP